MQDPKYPKNLDTINLRAVEANWVEDGSGSDVAMLLAVLRETRTGLLNAERLLIQLANMLYGQPIAEVIKHEIECAAAVIAKVQDERSALNTELDRHGYFDEDQPK